MACKCIHVIFIFGWNHTDMMHRAEVFAHDLQSNGYGKYAAQHYYQIDANGPYDNDALQGMN